MKACTCHGLALALGLTSLVRVAGSQTPNRLADVPLPPGARADTSSTAGEPGCWTEDCRTYRVPAAMEAVVRFYQQRLAAQPSGDLDAQGARDAALQELAAGGTTPVFYQVKTWTEVLESYPPAGRQSVAPLLATVRRRPPYQPHEWLGWASFSWGSRKGDTEVTLDITINDATNPGGEPQTTVRIQVVS